MFNTMLNTMIMLSIVISTGFYLQKKQIINDEVKNKLTYILLNVSMPATFFMSFQIKRTPELLSAAKTILILSLLMHLFFMLIGFILTKIMKSKKDEAGIIIFSLTFKNLSYIGLPIMTALYVDKQPGFFVTLYCITFNILAFSLGPMLLTKESGVKIKLSDFSNNINISVVLGFLCFLFGITMPKPVATALSTISQLTIPVSLFLTGALLTKSDFKTIFKEYKVLFVSFVNLIILPILFFTILKPINADPFLKEFASVMSLLPSASLTLILTDRYNGNVDFAGKLVLTTTLFSLFTAVILSGIAFI